MNSQKAPAHVTSFLLTQFSHLLHTTYNILLQQTFHWGVLGVKRYINIYTIIGLLEMQCKLVDLLLSEFLGTYKNLGALEK